MTSTEDRNSLRGKVVLITGASGGIGSATALSLARLGATIAVHYHSSEDKADVVSAQILDIQADLFSHTTTECDMPRVAAFQADLSTYTGVRTLHAAVVAKLGPVDVLFNNSGVTGSVIGANGDIESVSVEEYEGVWRTNTGTSFLLTQLCIPHMREQKWGRIVFCSSVAAGIGGVVGPHYASSKSAIHGLVHWVASRYAAEGITCNAVAPALIIETTMLKPSEELRKKIPVGRFGLPKDIASIVELLVTNSYMTNKIIVADGGLTASAF